LRGDLELLPQIAEAGLSRAAKDISQGGLIGTAAMLAECSGVGIEIDIRAIPMPDGVPLERWLLTFPSFGYLLAVAATDVDAVTSRFAARGIAAADIGAIIAGSEVAITDGVAREAIWNVVARPLLQCAPQEAAA
jgi:hypothetical protein